MKKAKKLRRPRLPTVWATREGKRHVIRFMSSLHLLNCIKMLQRKRLAECEAFYRAGDQSDFVYAHMTSTFRLMADPAYQALCREAKRRSLSY